MRKSVIFLIALMLAGCLAACSAPPTIKEFKSEAGGFAVMTPAPLQESVQPVETQDGKIDLHLFSAQQDEIAYFVAYCDYAPELARAGQRREDAGRRPGRRGGQCPRQTDLGN